MMRKRRAVPMMTAAIAIVGRMSTTLRKPPTKAERIADWALTVKV